MDILEFAFRDKAMNDPVICVRCGDVMERDRIPVRCIFPGIYALPGDSEPPEFEGYCRGCGAAEADYIREMPRCHLCDYFPCQCDATDALDYMQMLSEESPVLGAA